MTVDVAAKPKLVWWVRGGRAFARFDNGWLDLGPEAAVLALDEPARLALVSERLKGPHWYPIPEKVN